VSAADLPGRAKRTLADMGAPDAAKYIEHQGRPLVGQRAAMAKQTLDDLVTNAADPTAARKSVDDYLASSGQKYDDIAHEQLGRTFGFGLGDDAIGFNVPGISQERVAAAFDRIGEAARWGKLPLTNISPGVAWNAKFGIANAGRTSAMGQAMAQRFHAAGQEGAAKGRVKAADSADLLRRAKIDPAVAARTGINDVWSTDAFEAIDRVVEGLSATPKDYDFVNSTPEVKQFVERWLTQDAPGALAASKDMGLRAHQLQHAYGAGYRPYQLEGRFDDIVGGPKTAKTAIYDTVTGDMLKRQKMLMLPGGIDQLRHYSTDARFVNGRGINPATGQKWTDDAVAQILHSEINDVNSAYWKSRQGSRMAGDLAAGNAKEYSLGKAKVLADFLNKLPGDVPIYGNSTVDATTQYLSGRERLLGMAPEIYKTLTAHIVANPKGSVVGGKHLTVAETLNQLGLVSPNPQLKALKTQFKNLSGAAAINPATKKAWKFTDWVASQGKTIPLDEGARQKMREYIGKATGQAADSVNLSQYSVPQSLIDEMKKVETFYNDPGDQGKFIENLHRLFKSQVLLWPSRYTRDFSSSAVGNAIVAGAGPSMLGYTVAKPLLGGDLATAVPLLRQLPRYANITDDDALLNAFYRDAADSNILGGVGADRNGIDRTGTAVKEMLPGAVPTSLGGIASDLKERVAANPRAAADYFGVSGMSWGNNGIERATTTNPIYKAGEELGDYTDSISRMAGYIGLLSKGVSPREAADRMRAVHVQYDNLTPFEKKIRGAVPFYAYKSRSGAWAVDQLMRKPMGTYGQIAMRVPDSLQRSDDETYIPQTLREQTGFALPESTPFGLGKPAPGQRGFISNLEVPGLAALNTASVAFSGDDISLLDSITSTGQNVMKDLSPYLKAPLEIGTQQDFFTKRPLRQSVTPIERTIRSVSGDEDFKMHPLINKGIDVALPGFSRVFNAASQVTDVRQPTVASAVGETVFNNVMPFKYRRVDTDRQRRDALGFLDDQFKNYGTMELSTVSDEDFASMPADQQRLYLLRRNLQEKERKAQKASKDKARRAQAFAR